MEEDERVFQEPAPLIAVGELKDSFCHPGVQGLVQRGRLLAPSIIRCRRT